MNPVEISRYIDHVSQHTSEIDEVIKYVPSSRRSVITAQYQATIRRLERLLQWPTEERTIVERKVNSELRRLKLIKEQRI